MLSIIRAVERDLPSGTVTFLFTDVEGSTKLLHALGAEGYADALATHRRLLREAFAAHGGVEVDTQGDAFFVAFPTAPGALAAADQARAALASGPIRVRIGVHTGTPHLTDEGYVGADVHRAARIAAAGHGGQILVSDATAALLPDGAGLRDLGLHRLKDLTAPERIYQLGDEEHPPLKTLHQTNLPVPATPFLGREAEVAEVRDLLIDPTHRLVTLTGPGGTGKTRLALQAAADAAEAFPGGVWWVPLAPLRDPALVLPSAAKALGASGDLAEHIGDSRLLLLLDNFEHLVAAAADLAPLLSACPKLVLLVTSREPLHLAGEHGYAVEPLRRAEAVELFMTRALAARRDVVANGEVALICERLDDLPLAIELAAARAKLLSPAALLERLEQRLPLLAAGTRDAPERQRTLRATIEWSHELLTPAEQRLFARLAVFRGGCTLDAAEQVAEADLDTLQSLVDKSLVRVRGNDRFWMLETVREYAHERLEASGETDALGRRQAEFFVALAEEAHPKISYEPKEWLSRLESEHDNLRGALDAFTAAGDHRAVARLAGELWPFWYLAGHLLEAESRLAHGVREYDRPDAIRAKALNGATAIALERGDNDAARRHALEARAIHERLDDPWALANSRFLLAQVTASEGDWSTGRTLLEESVRAFSALGDDHFTMLATRTLAWMYEELGDIDRYRELTQQNLQRARAAGNQRMEARAQASLAGIAIKDGRVAEGLAMYQSSLRIDRDVGDQQGVRLDLYDIAEGLSIAGDLHNAARLLARTEKWREETGAVAESWIITMNEGTLERLHSGLSPREFAGAWERGGEMSVEEAVELALSAEVPSNQSGSTEG